MAERMTTRWVVNASPLISLGHIGQLGLLSSLAQEVVVVPAVVTEVLHAADAASAALTAALSASQLHQVKAVEPDSTIALWGLGAGETEVLSFARHHLAQDYEVVLDDRAARQCARSFNIRTRGTLGIVLLAKRHGLIPSAAAVIESLQMAGLFLSPTIVAQALALVGESPVREAGGGDTLNDPR